jgi:hypothetical protein
MIISPSENSQVAPVGSPCSIVNLNIVVPIQSLDAAGQSPPQISNDWKTAGPRLPTIGIPPAENFQWLEACRLQISNHWKFSGAGGGVHNISFL